MAHWFVLVWNSLKFDLLDLLQVGFYLKHFIVLEGERKRSLSEFVEKSDKGPCDCLDPPHYCTVASTETRKIRDFMCGNLFSYLRSTFPLVNRKISFLSQHIFLISDPTPKRQGLFVSLSRSAVKSLFYQWLGKKWWRQEEWKFFVVRKKSN